MNNPFNYDRSLLTVDISGAQPKQKQSYLEKITPSDIKFNNHMRQQYTIPKQDPLYGRRRYQHDFHHFCNGFIPQGENYFDGSHKKHFNLHEGEIKQYRALENYYDQPKNSQGDRQFITNDIDGAIPGTNQSKVLKNQEKAQKLRLERSQLRAQNNRALYHSQIDGISEQEGPEKRIKSYSISPAPIIQQQEVELPKYEYMNKPLKLPSIIDRGSPVINPISNKLQFRQNNQNYLLQDCDKQLFQLQQNQPQRLFV